MKARILMAVGLLALTASLARCGGASGGGSTGPPPNPPSINGNWEITLTSAVYQPFSQSRAGLFVDNVNTTVIGAWQSDSSCVSGVVQVTGTFVAPNLSLSGSVGQASISLSTQVSQQDDSLLGTYQAYFLPDVCADHGTLTGMQVPSFAGQWIGSGTSQTTGNTIQISLTLTEQGTDASGFPTLTGPANVQGLSCLDGSGTFSGDQRGLTIAGPSDGAAIIYQTPQGNNIALSTQLTPSTGLLPPSDNSNSIAMTYTVGCPSSGITDNGTLTLKRQ